MNIQAMCEAYGVSKSGYYAWLNRKDSPRQVKNAQLAAIIKKIHLKSYGVYGSPRITVILNRQGIEVSENRVARIMRCYSIVDAFIRKRDEHPPYTMLLSVQTINDSPRHCQAVLTKSG